MARDLDVRQSRAGPDAIGACRCARLTERSIPAPILPDRHVRAPPLARAAGTPLGVVSTVGLVSLGLRTLPGPTAPMSAFPDAGVPLPGHDGFGGPPLPGARCDAAMRPPTHRVGLPSEEAAPALMAIMPGINRARGASPRSFVVVSLVGAHVVDLADAATIQAVVSWLARADRTRCSAGIAAETLSVAPDASAAPSARHRRTPLQKTPREGYPSLGIAL